MHSIEHEPEKALRPKGGVADFSDKIMRPNKCLERNHNSIQSDFALGVRMGVTQRLSTPAPQHRNHALRDRRAIVLARGPVPTTAQSGVAHSR
jgi:hypothetical protein